MKQKQRKAVFWTVIAILIAIYLGFVVSLIYPAWWVIPLVVGVIGVVGLIVWLLIKFEKWASKPDPE